MKRQFVSGLLSAGCWKETTAEKATIEASTAGENDIIIIHNIEEK